MKRTQVKVRRFDYGARQLMPNSPENYIEIPLGVDLEQHVRGIAEYGGEAGPRQIRQFLVDQGVRPRDAIVAAYPEYRNLGGVQVRELVTNDSLMPLFGPLIQQSIADGFNGVAPNWQALVNTVPLDAGSVEDFQFEDPNSSDSYVLNLIGQGARIPTARITVGSHKIIITAKGRGIEWTDKARRAPVSLANKWLQGVGMRLGKFYFNHIGVIARDGYFDDMSDAPTVVLTADTTKFQLGDLLKGKYVQDETGFPTTDIMMSSNTQIALLTQTISGTGFVFPDGVAVKLGLPADAERINDAVGDNVIIFMNRDQALNRFEAKPFGTEEERVASQGITASYATLEDEIVVNEKLARTVVKKGW